MSDLTESASVKAGTINMIRRIAPLRVKKAVANAAFRQLLLRSASRETYAAVSISAGGTAGRIYPGSFEPENEKNASGTISQASPRATRSVLANTRIVLL